MRLASTKIQKKFGTIGLTNDSTACSGVVSRNISGYLAQRGLLTITTEVFSRNKSDGTRFSKFHRKRVLPNGEAVGHPWLIHLAVGMANKIFCYYCKLFSSGCALALHPIPPLWRYYTRYV